MNDILHDVSWVIPYRNDFLTPIFETLTWLGYPTFIMFFLPLGYWLWNKNKFTRLAVIVIVSSLLNSVLKDLWQNPRPDALFRLDSEVGKSFGMPSGHAQVSAVLWFCLAYEIKQRWAWVVASLLVGGIAFSRIYLGIHDLEDILAGLAIAAATIYLYRWSLTSTFDKFRSLSVWVHCLIILAVQTIVYATWPGFGYSIGAISLGGFLIAWLIGAHINDKHIQFEIRNDLWATPLVAVLGITGLILLTSILKPFLAANFDPHIAGYARATIAAFYMTAVAPFIFKAIQLGQKP